MQRSHIIILALVLAGGVAVWFRPVLPHPLPTAASTDGSGKHLSDAEKGTARPANQTANDWSPVSSTDTDGDLLRRARIMVARSPLDALAWVQAQTDAALRQRVLLAVMRAWGEQDPRAAVNWALTQDPAARESIMKAALTGAATQPELAMRIAGDLLAQDRDSGGVYATMLASAFSAAGNFPAALRFINQASADAMTDPVKAAFRAWAQSRPQAALAAVNSVTDPQLRRTAFQAAVAAWNDSNPGSLAAYANAMPHGSDRDYALEAAIDNWSLQDPAAMAAWLNTLPHGDEFDFGTAMMIVRTDGANLPPARAMQWVASINDPELRLDSLFCVLGEWRQSDAAAAQQYVTGASWLDEPQRQAALSYLAGR